MENYNEGWKGWHINTPHVPLANFWTIGILQYQGTGHTLNAIGGGVPSGPIPSIFKEASCSCASGI